MKKANRKIIFCLALSMMAIGCDLFGPSGPDGAAYMGKMLAVDQNGHFTRDVTYETASWKITYKSDGSYEETISDYEYTGEDYDGDGIKAEGWVQSYGSKGSYTYDPKTYTTTYHETGYYSANIWRSWISTTTNEEIFTENSSAKAYRYVSPGVWESRYTSADASSSIVWVSAYRYAITPTSLTYTYKGYEQDGNGNKTLREERVAERTVSNTKPVGIAFEKGKTVTFNLRQTSEKYRVWNPAGNAMGSWVEDLDQYSLSMAFVHNGDFIFKMDGALSRKL